MDGSASGVSARRLRAPVARVRSRRSPRRRRAGSSRGTLEVPSAVGYTRRSPPGRSVRIGGPVPQRRDFPDLAPGPTCDSGPACSVPSWSSSTTSPASGTCRRSVSWALVGLPAMDASPRERVATPAEYANLLSKLPVEDAVPQASRSTAATSYSNSTATSRCAMAPISSTLNPVRMDGERFPTGSPGREIAVSRRFS